jgi:hypothetical protein
MKPEDVLLSVDPWVSGMRSEGWGISPVREEMQSAPGQEGECFEKLVETMREKAASQGFNAIVGVEFVMDPFAKGGCHMQGVGTMGLLRPFFGGEYAL